MITRPSLRLNLFRLIGSSLILHSVLLSFPSSSLANPMQQTLGHLKRFICWVQPLAGKNPRVGDFANRVSSFIKSSPKWDQKPSTFQEEHFENATLLGSIHRELDPSLDQASDEPEWIVVRNQWENIWKNSFDDMKLSLVGERNRETRSYLASYFQYVSSLRFAPINKALLSDFVENESKQQTQLNVAKKTRDEEELYRVDVDYDEDDYGDE